MKQAELDRLLNKLLKGTAKARGWRSAGGYVYWKEGHLFFNLVVHGQARKETLHHSLKVKWFTLDETLWKILDMPENLTGPASLHANGAFTIYGEDVDTGTATIPEWKPDKIQFELDAIATSSAAKSADVHQRIQRIDDYLLFIEQSYAALLKRYPNAARDIWTERLLVAIEKADRDTALSIARARIAAKDSGYFISRGKTFYERAAEYLS